MGEARLPGGRGCSAGGSCAGASDPPSDGGAGVVVEGGLVVVVPAEDRDLFEKVEVGEVVMELFDEGRIVVMVEGVSGVGGRQKPR